MNLTGRIKKLETSLTPKAEAPWGRVIVGVGESKEAAIREKYGDPPPENMIIRQIADPKHHSSAKVRI